MAKQQGTDKLNDRQRLFCCYYAETGNARQSAIRAGYSERSSESTSSTLLTYPKIQAEIAKLREPKEREIEHHIATSQEVMEFFTKMMNGEIKDAFGLDATNGDRLKAANELAKRTVDIDNRAEGKADTKVEISINWTRNKHTDE